MAENKTQFNDADVTTFLETVTDEHRRQDCYAVLEMMREVTGEEPRMYGTSIVGFGRYHYKYATGREGDAPLAGFSPRKQNLTLYIMAGFDQYEQLLGRLGKFKLGQSCLYIKKLADVDQDTLREMIAQSVAAMRHTYPTP